MLTTTLSTVALLGAVQSCNPPSLARQGALAVLILFSAVYAHVLMILDDAEMHELAYPLPLHQVRCPTDS
jgi:hypothetical protein